MAEGKTEETKEVTEMSPGIGCEVEKLTCPNCGFERKFRVRTKPQQTARCVACGYRWAIADTEVLLGEH